MRTRILFLTVVALGISIQVPPACAQADTDQIRSAVTSGLQIVQTAARNYPHHRSCFSCHHQTLPMLAMELAGQKGLEIDRELLHDQAQFAWETFAARQETLAQGKGIGGASMTVGYGLWSLDIAKWKPDATTTAMVSYLLKKQGGDGCWKPSTSRPPLEDSKFTCTALAVYYGGKFASDAQRPEVEKAASRARAWMEATEPTSHEDRVSRLGALALLKADPQEIDKVRHEILVAQMDDGGWSQLPEMASDAYATGLTLFTLQRTGLPVTHPQFQRGVQFLLDTQCDDGSWFVKSRSHPIQQFFDNGDPHGKDQFISISATAWGTAALALALPAPVLDVSDRAPLDR